MLGDVELLSEKDFAEIKKGHCVLLLGAGATFGSSRFKNPQKPILNATGLATMIANKIEIPYENEALRDVYDAAIQEKGKSWINKLLEKEYTDIKPSSYVADIFNYPWYRIYTLNIDDSLNNTPKKNRVQNIDFVNGVNTDRIEWAGVQSCQVVHLHGKATEIDQGVVFSDDEYGMVYERRLGWYQQLREDFRTRNVYIIGSQLDEPFILSLIKREADAIRDAQDAMLITPSPLSKIRLASLKRAAIVHKSATLETFISNIASGVGPKYSPEELIAKEADIDSVLLKNFSKSDIGALQGLFMLDSNFLSEKKQRSDADKRAERSTFFNGYGPNWGVIADHAIAELHQFSNMDREVRDSLRKNILTIVTGEAGCGKTTYIQRICANLVNEKSYQIFQYMETSTSFFDVIDAVKKLSQNTDTIVLINNFYLHSQDVAAYLSRSTGSNIRFLVSSRPAEWRNKLAKHFNDCACEVKMGRFNNQDILTIVDTIDNFFIAPSFNRLKKDERIARFRKCRKQLLFAIREASQSKIFDEIIRSEVAGIVQPDAKNLLILISLSTAARVGLSDAVAASIMDQVFANNRDPASFSETLRNIQHLEGIIDRTADGLLKVRHDTYASQVIEKYTEKEKLIKVIHAVVSHFAQFRTPIISNITKMEAQLFKYVLNNKNIYKMFGKSEVKSAITMYADMEHRLQLDGHFWLQYGLLQRRIGNHDRALEKLNRSIEAYPNNDYAWHARAHQQLVLAANLKDNRLSEAKQLIEKAVNYFITRYSSNAPSLLYLDDNDFPLTVLGNYHIDALIHIGEYTEAKQNAKKYYEWIGQLEKNNKQLDFEKLKIRLLKLATSGFWDRNIYRIGQTDYL